MASNPNDMNHFWRAAGPRKWFAKSQIFDSALQLRFEPVHHAASRGEYDAWIDTAEGALALILLLDQVPRNLYRGSAHAFATDSKARGFARMAVARGYDQQIEPLVRPFMYLPFEHSEDLADQDESIRLATLLRNQEGDENTLKWALIHRDIIVRFGRFPHRNAMFGRINTAEEELFLADGGFSG